MHDMSYMERSESKSGVVVPRAYLESLEKDSILLQALLSEDVMDWDGYVNAKRIAEGEE